MSQNLVEKIAETIAVGLEAGYAVHSGDCIVFHHCDFIDFDLVN